MRFLADSSLPLQNGTTEADTNSIAGVRGFLMRWSEYRAVLIQLCRDDRGGEVLEYALVSGLIVIAAISIIRQVGTKVLAKWTSLNSSM